MKLNHVYNGLQWIFEYPNGYGASVICHDGSYGGPEGYFEIAVLDSEGSITYDTPLTSDVAGNLTFNQVSKFLKKIQKLPAINS